MILLVYPEGVGLLGSAASAASDETVALAAEVEQMSTRVRRESTK